MKYVFGNLCLGLGHAQKCGGVCMWYMHGTFFIYFV